MADSSGDLMCLGRVDVATERDLYRALLELARDATLVIDSGCVVACNARAEDLFGGQEADIVGQPVGRFLVASVSDTERPGTSVAEQIERVGSGEERCLECLGQRAGGEFFAASVNARRLDMENGSLLYLLVRAAMCSERGEHAERAEVWGGDQPLLETLLESVTDSIYYKDRDARHRLVSQQMLHGLGFENLEQIAGKTDVDLYGTEYGQERLAEDLQLMETGEAIEGAVESRLLEDGLVHWWSTTKVPVRAPDGQVTGLVGITREITDLMRAEEMQRDLRQTLQRIVDHIPQSVSWKDRNLVYLGCNQAFADDAGLESPEDIAGKSDYDMPWGDQAELYRQDDLSVISSGTPRLNREDSQTAPNGDRIWLRTSKVPLRDADGAVWAVLGMSEDITDQKRIEQEREEWRERRAAQVRAAQVRAAVEVSQELAAVPALDELFRRVVSLVKERFGYYHVQIFRYQPALDAVVLVAGYGQVGETMLAEGHSLRLGEGVVGTAAATARTVLAPDVRQSTTWAPNPHLSETRGELAVPIVIRDRVLGILDVQSDTVGGLGEEDQLLLESICGPIALAIEDTNLRQEMEARLRELNTLQRIMTRQEWEAFRGREETVDGFEFDQRSVRPLSQGMSSVSRGSHRAVVAPMDVGGEVIGALGTYEDPDQPLSAGDREMLRDIAVQVTEALQRAQLLEQTQSRATRERVIRDIADRMQRATDMESLMRLTAQELTRVLHASRAYVRMGNEEQLARGEGLEHV